ncbi:MAG: hydrogenase maturation protease [Terracidiphilus sp.]
MDQTTARCLILACGNTLRGDDGIGPSLADWAENRFAGDPRVCVISRQQWTPELAKDLAAAHSVVFVDCSSDSAPGQVLLFPVAADPELPSLSTHHLGAPELLALARDLYGAHPAQAQILTIGAASLALSEELSPALSAALPEACRLLEESVLSSLTDPELPKEF